jgi:hypothetical protein
MGLHHRAPVLCNCLRGLSTGLGVKAMSLCRQCVQLCWRRTERSDDFFCCHFKESVQEFKQECPHFFDRKDATNQLPQEKARKRKKNKAIEKILKSLRLL